MIPVRQTLFGPGGDCYPACLASLLDCRLADVPALDGPGWAARLRGWLAARGLRPVFLRGGGEPPGGPCVASVRTVTGHAHAVVCDGGKIVHDPAPRPLATPSSPVLIWTVIEALP